MSGTLLALSDSDGLAFLSDSNNVVIYLCSGSSFGCAFVNEVVVGSNSEKISLAISESNLVVGRQTSQVQLYTFDSTSAYTLVETMSGQLSLSVIRMESSTFLVQLLLIRPPVPLKRACR